MSIVIVTGGRYYGKRETVFAALDMLHAIHGINLLIEGGASGADTLAREWAMARQVKYHTEPVTPEEWKELGYSAGPRRNKRMLEIQADAAIDCMHRINDQRQFVVAFPGGKGTANMVAQASKRCLVRVLKIGGLP